MLKELEHTTHRFITHYMVLIGVVAVVGIALWWLVSTLIGLAVLICAVITGLWFLVDQLRFEPQIRIPVTRVVARTLAWLTIPVAGCFSILWVLATVTGEDSALWSGLTYGFGVVSLLALATEHALKRWQEDFAN